MGLRDFLGSEKKRQGSCMDAFNSGLFWVGTATAISTFSNSPVWLKAVLIFSFVGMIAGYVGIYWYFATGYPGALRASSVTEYEAD